MIFKGVTVNLQVDVIGNSVKASEKVLVWLYVCPREAVQRETDSLDR